MNICKLCGTPLIIYTRYGVCSDVSYGVKCKCRSYGMEVNDDIGYFGIFWKMKEWRIPTRKDKFDEFIDKIVTSFNEHTYTILSPIDRFVNRCKNSFFKKEN